MSTEATDLDKLTISQKTALIDKVNDLKEKERLQSVKMDYEDLIRRIIKSIK